MNAGSRISEWVCITVAAVLSILTGCATEPYYEAAPITPINVSPGEDVNIGVNAQVTFAWQPTENTHFYEFHIYNQNSKDTAQYWHDNLLQDNICQQGICRLTLNVDLPITEGHAWRVRAGNNAGLSEWNRTRFNMIEASSAANENAITELNADTELTANTEPENTEPGVASESVTNSEPETDAETSPGEPASTSSAAVVSAETLPSVELISSVEEKTEPGGSTKSDKVAGVEASASAESTSSTELTGPNLLQPTQDAEVATGSLIAFKWRSLPGAVSYDFYIYDSTSNKTVESLTEVAAATLCRGEDVCSITRVVSMPEAKHSWKVRANFPNDQSPFASSGFAVIH